MKLNVENRFKNDKKKEALFGIVLMMAARPLPKNQQQSLLTPNDGLVASHD